MLRTYSVCIILILFTFIDFFGTCDEAKGGALDIIMTKLDLLSRSNERMTQAVIATTRPKAQSGKSERDHHQAQFKIDVINRYCCDVGAPPNHLRCMVLNTFVPSHRAIAGHIIGLKERESGVLNMLGLRYEDVWDPRNGLIWWHEIETAKENMEVVRLLFVVHILILPCLIC
jgi:hypothetical protein